MTSRADGTSGRGVRTILAHPDASRRALYQRSLERHEAVDVIASLDAVHDLVETTVALLPDVLAVSTQTDDVDDHLRAIRTQAPVVRVLILDADADDAWLLRDGAFAALSEGSREIARAVVGVASDESVMGAGWAAELLEAIDEIPPLVSKLATLTPNERSVIEALAHGSTIRDVADEHEVTERLVGLHLGYIVGKFHRAVEAIDVLNHHHEARTDALPAQSQTG